MAFIPVAGAARVSMIFDNAGQQVVNTFHFSRDHAWTEAELDGINTAMHTWWTNQLKPISTSAMALTAIVAASQESASAPVRTLSIVPPEAGTGAAPGTAAGTALVVTHRTGSRGRSFRGRTYYGPLANSYFGTQFSTSLTQISNLLTAFQWLLTAANTAGAAWVVVSRFFNKNPRITGTKTLITAVTADTSFDSMRRRLLGRGA